jgi:hypothetical protein
LVLRLIDYPFSENDGEPKKSWHRVAEQQRSARMNITVNSAELAGCGSGWRRMLTEEFVTETLKQSLAACFPQQALFAGLQSGPAAFSGSVLW